jgi:hypothetical protein
MKRAHFLALLLFALVAVLAAGCGGSGTAKLQPTDVAVVGNEHVKKSDFDALLSQAKMSYQQQGHSFPKQGTTQYQTIQGQAVTLLVQQAERDQKAQSMGIHISAKQIQQRLDQIKKQYFQGSEKKYEAQLKKEHLTDAQVRDDVKAQLVSEAIVKKVTGNVSVSNKEVHDYYVAHKSLYLRPESRDVRHVLVKTKALAFSLYSRLKSGSDATWCKIAKQYSQDPGSKDNCGRLTVTKGETVPVFNKVAFTGPTKVVHPPVHDPRYGWFVIEPLSPVRPPSATPEAQVASSIRQELLQNKKNEAMTNWVKNLTKSFCSGSKIKYQPGYRPTPDPCAAATTTTTASTNQ